MLLPVINKIKTHHFFGEIFTKHAFGQFKRYLVTGFSSFGIEYTFFALLFNVVLVRYFQNTYIPLYAKVSSHFANSFNIILKETTFRGILANVPVYIVIFWFNFMLNRVWSFKSKEKLSRQMALYGLVFVLNLFVGNILLMYLLSNVFHISPLLAKFFITGAIVSWNFIIYKKVIYKN